METTRLWNENLRNKKKFETHVNYSKYTILDPKVCRSCLRNLTDRSLILKGSTNHSRDEVSQFADQVSLYSECTQHCLLRESSGSGLLSTSNSKAVSTCLQR
ncbi:unnamed protein product [Brassica oleracea var. botrytis]